jgi:serine protease AprX
MASRGITWNAVATQQSARGITWNAEAVMPAAFTWRRSFTAASAVALLTATVAASGVAVAIHRNLIPAPPVGVGHNPWFADPAVSPDGKPTLPDQAALNRVINAPQAWQNGANGQGVDVAVLDSGISPVRGLDAPGKVVPGVDLSFDSQNPNTAYLDGFGHGTAMAGIIAGNDGESGGYRGVAPGARVVSVKVGAATGAVDVSQIIAGIDWVTEHAHDNGMNIRVLNVSLGTDSNQWYGNDPLAAAAENAWRKGIVVVAAVGNDGSTNTVATPASDPYVVAVGASDPNGTEQISDDVAASFSNRGNGSRRVDLVAPGAYVVGLRTPGSYLDQTYPQARVGDRYFRGSGTSQAAAMVSGAAADILSARPGMTPDQVKAALTNTAKSISGNKNTVGSGLVNVYDAARSSLDNKVQAYAVANGLGTLEGARGSSHLVMNGVTLSGEKDIFGNPWSSAAIAAARTAGATWSGGNYNGATWSGATWSGATWSGATWSGATWSGATWSGATWSSATWSGATWSGATWSGATWSGSTWSGATWSGSTWSGSTWSGSTWSGGDWT